MRMAFGLIALLAVLGGCYEDPMEMSLENIIKVTLENDPESAPGHQPVANGKDRLMIVVEVDKHTSEDKVVTIKTTSGLLNVAAEKDSAESRTLTVKPAADGIIETWLVVGVEAGEIIVDASIDDYTSTDIWDLEPAPLAAIVLDQDKTYLSANGNSDVNVTASLFAQDGSASLGTLVFFKVCCFDTEDELAECPGAPPLRIPQFAALEQGQKLTVSAESEFVEVEVPEDVAPEVIEVTVLARAILSNEIKDPADVDLACSAPDSTLVWDMISVTLKPEARVIPVEEEPENPDEGS